MKKKCSDCSREKDIAEFHKKKDNADGYKSFCRFCSAVRLKKWREKNKGKRKQHDKKYKTKYPEKIIARNALNKAIIKGDIKRKPCKMCRDNNSQAHHPDYCFPFKVIWLCPKHHAEEHQ